MTDVPVRWRSEDRDTQGECHVKNGAMLPQGKEINEARERSGTDPSLMPSEEAGLANTLISDYKPPELLDNKFLLLKLPSLWSLFRQSQQTNIITVLIW